MKKITCMLMAIFYTWSAYTQTTVPFKPLRYDEDYSVLKNDTVKTWYRNLKYAPLIRNGRSYISMGGEIRFQYFNIKNEGWSDKPKDKDGYAFSRFLVHTDVHAGSFFRAFVQVQSSMANGKMSTSPVDENPLELHQAFVDIKSISNTKNQLTFRLGRQELSYGSQRIIAVRDGPNNRQSFDGLKAIFVAGKYKIDLFYTNYVAAKKGIFNDGFNKNVKLWGAYTVRNKIFPSVNIDAYYLGLWKKNAVFDDAAGKELRHSLGSRIWGSKNNWRYDVEGLYQFGKSDTKTISAYTASVNTAYRFSNAKLKPELGLKTELISGDAKYGDNKLNSFNPLFPRGAYFGLASLIGPANLIDAHPSVSLALSRHLDWNIDYDIFWRYSKSDGIYAPSGSLIYSGKSMANKFIGQQTSTDFVFTPNNFLYMRGEFTWFKSGAFLKASGPGKDIFFTCITTQLKF